MNENVNDTTPLYFAIQFSKKHGNWKCWMYNKAGSIMKKFLLSEELKIFLDLNGFKIGRCMYDSYLSYEKDGCILNQPHRIHLLENRI